MCRHENTCIINAAPPQGCASRGKSGRGILCSCLSLSRCFFWRRASELWQGFRRAVWPATADFCGEFLTSRSPCSLRFASVLVDWAAGHSILFWHVFVEYLRRIPTCFTTFITNMFAREAKLPGKILLLKCSAWKPFVPYNIDITCEVKAPMKKSCC